MASAKRKVLTLDDRIRVIELSKGKSARKIAEEMGVGKTQIQNILKRKAEVLNDFENNVSGDRKRVRRMTGNEDINELVFQWFNDATTRNLPVSGPLLQQQALKFASELGNVTFKASTGWLASFLKRHNIVLGTMSGERGDVDKECVESWKTKLPKICEGYDPKDIFNMDETGLFYRDTTRKSYHFKGQELAGGKRSKERLTVSLCASMTGEKLKPLVIGKSARPRCFSKIKTDKLPVIYRNNKKAWMTGELMTEWLKSVDRQMRRQGRHILLFLDNAPSHPKVTFENIKLVFLPPNTTALSQPMDQGIIQAMKLKYRRRQLQFVLTQMEKNDKVGSSVLKEITILDAIYWVNRAWNEIERSTIQKCFAKCGLSVDVLGVEDVQSVEVDDSSDDSDSDDDDDIPLYVMKMSHDLFGCDFQQLVAIDANLAVCDTNTTDWSEHASVVLNELRNGDEHDDEEDDEEIETVEEEVISMIDAHCMLDKLKGLALNKGKEKWLDEIMNLQEMFLTCRSECDTKQSKITEFFKK